jgi:hypothetical protein
MQSDSRPLALSFVWVPLSDFRLGFARPQFTQVRLVYQPAVSLILPHAADF